MSNPPLPNSRLRPRFPSRRQIVGLSLFLVLHLIGSSSAAAFFRPPPEPYPAASRSADQSVKPNRTPPNVDPVPTFPRFSDPPSEEEITRARIFAEPLLKVGSARENVAETRALADALGTYFHQSDASDVSRLLRFSDDFPDSPWNPSLLANLGRVFRQTGYFTKAMEAWEKAWRMSKSGDDPNSRAVADGAAGDLAETYTHLGRLTELESLLADLSTRDLRGPVTEKISQARECLALMRRRPQEAYRCGLHALDSLRRVTDPSAARLSLEAVRAPADGMSLNRLSRLARDFGMRLRPAYREPGGEVVVPSVMHWKVNHYSAIVERATVDGATKYLLENPLFERLMWVSRDVIDAEGGYFLIPDGKLPERWRDVGFKEADTVFGKCGTRSSDPYFINRNACTVKGCARRRGLADYDFHAMAASLNIVDVPVGYSPPFGPAPFFEVVYNQREAHQPNVFSFSNLGPKWTHDWLSYVTDQGSNTATPREVTVYLRGGAEERYRLRPQTTSLFETHLFSRAVLERTGRDTYERRLPDGSKEIFAQSDNGRTERRVFLSQIVDPAGNALKLTHDSRLRLVAATDAAGQVTTIAYESATDPLKITRVTDPFGRSARFEYNSAGQLTKITDVIGLASEFEYGDGDFVRTLGTPYGATRFTTGENPNDEGYLTRFIEATDPLGDAERLEFKNYAPGVASKETVAPAGVYNADLDSRTSYYWDKNALREARGDYTKARAYHWLTAPLLSQTSGVLDSVKPPFENRVWYRYQGQRSNLSYSDESVQPERIARVLDDGTTQEYLFEYNDLGNLVKSTDPAKRVTTFVRGADGIDIVRVLQGNDTVARYTYNSQHLPVTLIDAAGQTTTISHTERGQPRMFTNAKGEKVTVAFDAVGYPIRFTGPDGQATVSLTHDAVGRVKSVTDSDGDTLAYEYDALDRPTKITYPDGTFESFTYNRLDLVGIRDRRGRTTQATYDALGRVVAVTDAAGQTTTFGWCGCGALRQATNPLGHAVTWNYDVAGRLVSKVLADGSQLGYAYERTTSRLRLVTDAKRQVQEFQYFIDDTVKQIAYSNARVATPTVRFGYDAVYNRLTTLEDGIGTTRISHHPVGVPGALQVAAADGPLANDTITYAYDELGRTVRRAINGVEETTAYDVFGRVTRKTNPLGDFSFVYEGASDRPLGVTYPNGQKTSLGWFDGIGDRRLKETDDRTVTGQLLSRHAYAYLATGEIQTWTRNIPGLSPSEQALTFGYDQIGQVTDVRRASGGSVSTTHVYAYDKAGNRVLETVNGASSTFTYNSVDQLTERRGSSAATFTYDANGNLIGDGKRTYEWDAADRLTAAVEGKSRTELAYDGLGQCVRLVERKKKKVLSEKRFVWCGGGRCEERDATGAAVTRRFWKFGEQEGATKFFYTLDHLGSVRELTDETGAVVARYDYDPFGRPTRVSGTRDASFGYAGYYRLGQTGLWQTRYRVLDPGLARWLSRDPFGERGDSNLYRYVENDPIRLVDPTGLDGTLLEPRTERNPNPRSTQNRFILYVRTNSPAPRCFRRGSSVPSGAVRILRDVTTAKLRYAKFGTGGGTEAFGDVYSRLLFDDRGHIIGKQLGGSGSPIFCFPQNRFVNQGLGGLRRFRDFEDSIRAYIDANQTLTGDITVELLYGDSLFPLRPTRIKYRVRFSDGRDFYEEFDNPIIF